MATPLPPSSDFTGAAVTEGGFKTAITNLRTFLADLLGTDGTAATAISTLGAPSNKAAPSTDLNLIVTSGFYRLGTGLTNGPGGVDNGQLIVSRGPGDTIAQIAFDYTASLMYIRTGNPPDVGGSGTWAAWRNVAQSSDGEFRGAALYGASGTWTKPAGLKRIKVTCVGGGGGGSNSTNTGVIAHGGGGGGTAIKWIEAASLAAAESVTIGGGGGGATGASPIAGGTGGTTSFGGHCYATGGGGGPAGILSPVNVWADATALAVGGVGVNGSLNLAGDPASPPVQSWNGSSTFWRSGGGGGSTHGQGGGIGAVPSHGASGRGFGGGGAGGISNSTTDYNGGNGSSGLVIIEQYF